MPEILIVSRTRMHNGLCVGGIDLATNQSLRLLPTGEHSQPETSPLQIGEVWDIDYALRHSAAPFGEDADANIRRLLGHQNVASYVTNHVDVAVGDTNVLHNGLLHWNLGGKGYIDPSQPSVFSTQFWRPSGILFRNDGYKEGSSVFREAATNHKIPWVGAEAAPGRIQPGTLVRVSLGRPYPGTEDHPVCWLQLSGVY